MTSSSALKTVKPKLEAIAESCRPTTIAAAPSVARKTVKAQIEISGFTALHPS